MIRGIPREMTIRGREESTPLFGSIPLIVLEGPFPTRGEVAQIRSSIVDLLQCNYDLSPLLSECVTDPANLQSTVMFVACILNAVSPNTPGIPAVYAATTSVVDDAQSVVSSYCGSIYPLTNANTIEEIEDADINNDEGEALFDSTDNLEQLLVGPP